MKYTHISITGNLGKVMKESVECSYTAAIQYLERSIKRLNSQNRRYGGLNIETDEENSDQGKSA